MASLNNYMQRKRQYTNNTSKKSTNLSRSEVKLKWHQKIAENGEKMENSEKYEKQNRKEAIRTNVIKCRSLASDKYNKIKRDREKYSNSLGQ